MTPYVRLVGILILGVALVAGALLVLKWETPPMEKLATAEKAVRDAMAASAASLLPEDFAHLQDLLAKAKKEIEEQNGALGFLRNYAKADELLSAVIAEAMRLSAEAGKRQEYAKAGALQAQRAAQEAVMLAQDLVEEAPGGKDRVTLSLIRAELQKLGESLKEVQVALESHNYQEAQAKADEIRQKAESTNAELRHAIDKVKRTTDR